MRCSRGSCLESNVNLVFQKSGFYRKYRQADIPWRTSGAVRPGVSVSGGGDTLFSRSFRRGLSDDGPHPSVARTSRR